MENDRGYSLIESLLVVTVIGSLVFLMAVIPNAMTLLTKSRHLSLAREIATKQLEDKRAINYSNLINDSSQINDTRLNSLQHGSGTVVVEDCNPAVCTNGENIKQVTVNISWTDNSKPQAITLKTMIGEGGINQ